MAGGRTEKALHTVDDRRCARRSLGICCPSDRLVYGDDIRIGRVGALAAPIAPHRDKDDVRPFLTPALTFLPRSDGEGSEDGSIRGVGDRVSARIDAIQEVGHRATGQLTRAHSTDSGSCLGRILMAVNERRHFPSQPMRLARCQLVIVIEPGDGLGTLGERLGDPPGVREHGREPASSNAGVTQEREVPVRIADIFGQDPEIQQAHVGVGPRRKPRDKHGEQVALNCSASARPLRESSDMCEGTRRITVADRSEAVTRTICVQ